MRGRAAGGMGAIASALLLAGCAAGPAPTAAPSPGPTGGAPASGIAGEWRLTKGSDGEGAITPGGAPVTLAITGTDVAGQAPCNSYSASITVDGDSVAISPLSATELACVDDARMRLESRYFAALALVDSVRRRDNTLTLSGSGVTLRYSLLDTKHPA